MIDIEVKGALSDHLFPMLRGLRDVDPLRFGARIERILVEENERGLRDGFNADGSKTDELEASTIRRGRGGYGPPRIPRFGRSWPIAGFKVEVEQEGEYGCSIRAGWPLAGKLPLYFQEGTKDKDGTRRMVARPIAGLRPTTRAQLEEEAHKFGGDILEGGAS